VCTATHALKKEVPPMALSQSALSELLEVFRAGDGVDLIRESVGPCGVAGVDRSRSDRADRRRTV
jgi:hypothetical protein